MSCRCWCLSSPSRKWISYPRSHRLCVVRADVCVTESRIQPQILIRELFIAPPTPWLIPDEFLAEVVTYCSYFDYSVIRWGSKFIVSVCQESVFISCLPWEGGIEKEGKSRTFLCISHNATKIKDCCFKNKWFYSRIKLYW